MVNATALVNELGRRTPATVGFVEPDDAGDIVIPMGYGAGDTVQEARYRQVSPGPTRYLFVRVNYNFAEASNAITRGTKPCEVRRGNHRLYSRRLPHAHRTERHGFHQRQRAEAVPVPAGGLFDAPQAQSQQRQGGGLAAG